MSTLSGIVSKGEKGKSKFQSLDINSLYRVSRGESLEQHQQKSTLPRKHGMQSLGKVPSARRPPANLPSLKSEHSSSDPAVSLVPSGGSGWATTKDVTPSVTSTTTTTPTTPSDTTTTSNSPPAQCAVGTTPVSTTPLHPPLPGQQNTLQTSHASDVNKSSWSAIMSRPGDVGGVTVSQQQQQQQSQQNRESNAQYGPGPSLRPQTEGSWIQGGSRTAGGVGTGATGPGNGNTQAAQGPPVGVGGPPGHTEVPTGGRPNLGQSPGMAMAQAGPNGPQNNQGPLVPGPHQVVPNMHHYRGLIPPFMYRNNFPGGFPSQFPQNMGPGGPRPRFNYPSERFPPPNRQQERDRPPPSADEEIITRPIIKEEDLTRMDDISRDAGWAAHDDIDYNQKLAFSDDDTEPDVLRKEEKKEIIREDKREESPAEDRDKLRENRERDSRENRDQSTHRSWNQSSMAASRDFRGPNGPVNYPPQQQMRSAHPLRGVEEEEIWNQRRREQGEKVASAVERARQRKEEEEKRFQESTKQAAAKKLQDLEQKLKGKQAKQKDDDSGSSSEPKSLISVPPVPIPVPDWERDRENRERESRERERSRTSSEGKEEKAASRESRESRDNTARDSRESRDQSTGEFRQIVQIERPNFMRQQQDNNSRSERERDRDRDQREMRDREQPAFSRQFQSNLPPRFQKQQAERSGGNFNRVSPNAERSSAQSVPFSQQYDPSRWVHSNAMTDSGAKQSHSMPPPQRRNKADSELSGSMDEERPPSRDHRGPLRDDRYRHSSHRSYDSRKPGGYYDDYNRSYRDYEYDDRHSRDSWERDRHYDDKERDGRDSRDVRDNRDNRDTRDKDTREKKEYDSYSKSSVQQDPFDERERSESTEWRDDRRDAREDRGPQDRQQDGRRDLPRDDRIERNERPQRPDSRDSRASRESRTSLRDDESHKSRDCGSWVNDISDYEEKKRDHLYREETRERERDRRQPPGPVTREKLEADELKSEKRNLIQLKRGVSSELEKKEMNKDNTTDSKKEVVDAWSRKLDRTPENGRNTTEKGDNSPKAWADAVSPTFEKEEKVIEPINDEKETVDLKKSVEKLNVDKREDAMNEESKEEFKDEKRDKNVRNRTNSGSSRGREPRGGRQWGAYNVFSRGWRGSESRGRRGGGPRSLGRPGSARSGSYGHTDSELSGDEVSGSTESGKEEKRSTRSPKPSQKVEKEDRNREVSRREEKRNEYSMSRSEKRGYDGRVGREGFAPSGEPSRRGRGGFRSRGATTGGRMEGYGPPPSKSPFSTERTERGTDEKQQHGSIGQQNISTTISENDASAVAAQLESSDDKIMAKQQALTAGITGRHAKSPNQQSHQSNNKQEANHTNVGHNAASQRVQGRKEESRSKRNHSGNRRGRDSREARFRGSSSNIAKQSSSDVGNEDWETTSENSEEHVDDRKDTRSSRNKPFSHRGGNQGSSQNLSSNNSQSRRNDQSMNNRDQQREKSSKSSSASSRAPGAEKRNAQNAAFNNQRNHSGNIPLLMQNAQTQNGRPRSQGSTNSGSFSGKTASKESTVNRVDEIKLNDPNLVNQALSDINRKSQSKEKKTIDGEPEVNNYSVVGDDGANSPEDKLDSDGFQEVRSKKNVKESRHSQKEEPKSGRRDKEKERERDRSKSKSNGPQPTAQQIQNIPPLLSQPIPQPANMPQKQFERNPSRQKLPPRFAKQRLAKQLQQQIGVNEINDTNKVNSSNNYLKDSTAGPAPPPSVNAWDKPFTSQLRSNSPSTVSADIQLMSGLTAQSDQMHENNEQTNSGNSSQRNSPSVEKSGKIVKEAIVEKNVSDSSSPPVQTLIFENTNYSKTTKTVPSDLVMKSKFSNHIKSQTRIDKRGDIEEDNNQLQQHQQQVLSVAFSSKPSDLIKEKTQESIQMPLSFNKSEDNADMKLDFTFDSDPSQLTEDAKSKGLGMARSIHMTSGQSTISPSTAELNLKIASVKKVWENAPPMPTVVEHEDGNVVNTANSFPQAFESSFVNDSYSPHQQYNQGNMKNEITTSTNVCKVKPQQQSSGSSGVQPGSTVPGPSPIGPGQSPIEHPPASLQGPLSPPPFNSTGQPSHINYQEFPQYPGSQAAQYGSMSAIPSPPAVLFNTGSGQLPAQGGLYGAFQLDQSRSPFTQYPPYAPSLQSSFNQQNVYLQQPPPPHAPNAPTPDMYQSNLSQYRITAAGAPPFGQNQQLSNNPNTVLISSSSNSLMSASVKPSSQPIGAIGTKAQHFQAPSAPQPNQLAYIPYDPNQVLGVSGSYMGNSQLVQRPGPSVQPSANSYYSATSADVFPGSQTGFYQPGGAAQQTGTHYGLQGFGQHSQSLATGSATPVGLQNFSSQFLSGSGLQIAAAAAAQQFRNPTGGLPGPANAAATFLSKHQQQEQPRQLKSPSGNQQDVLASVFSSTPQIPSPKSRNCKQQTSSQQPQPSPTQHHKYQQYQGVSQSALVLQQNVRGMGMPLRAGIQPSQQRYPPPIQRPVVPFPPGPNPNNPTQQQPNCMPTQQQQAQINRHRPNIHQQQQRNMKMQQQYYSGQGNVKMDSNDKSDSHNDKITDGGAGNQSGGNKSNVNQQDGESKEEVNQQNE